MPKTHKYTRPSQKRLYNLEYHLERTDNLRLRSKVGKLVNIIPAKYNCEVVFSKRRIWFIRAGRKLIQLIAEKQRILLKIRTNQGWHETKLPEWQNFIWLWSLLEKPNIL
ncbi:MAG: hypothetical protein WC349_03895 [Patescibacteria group bacterium]|jgi:hypothetical protein